MVAAAVSRVRARTGSDSASSPQRRRPSAATWVIVGVPVVLALTFVWQIGSGFLRADSATRDAVAISSLTLNADPRGSRIDMVLVDSSGRDTAPSEADLTVKLREPDGTLWQTTRHAAAKDFTALSADSPNGGRIGYSVVVPASDWVRAPRRGGQASVWVTVQPGSGPAFSSTAEQSFP